MRLFIRDGRWYQTESAIYVTEKLYYTSRGNWIYHRYAEGEVIDEMEAVEIMRTNGFTFDDCPGYTKLPRDVKDQINSYLDIEHSAQDEV